MGQANDIESNMVFQLALLSHGSLGAKASWGHLRPYWAIEALFGAPLGRIRGLLGSLSRLVASRWEPQAI